MPAPSVTYTLTNGTTADASQVMQNFTDLINGVSDGTKDLSINALTCAGTATLNGSVALGNASADDLTVNASLASHLPIKTTNTYDIGSSSLGLRAAYFGANSQTVALRASPSASMSYTLTLPPDDGTANYVMMTNGSGTCSFLQIVNASVDAAAAIDGSKIVSASDTVGGVLTTSAQSIAGLKTFFDGIKLDDDANQDTFNYYREEDLASTFSGNAGGGASGSITMKITRIGRWVEVYVPSLINVVPTTNSTYLVATTALPSWARPSSGRSCMTQAYNNGAYATTPGWLSVQSDGTLRFYLTATGSATYTNSANAGWNDLFVSFYI